MAISLSTITGATVTGLTSPTYTVTADAALNAYSKQWAITAIGGTQTGVDTGSSVARPWTIAFARPQNAKQLNAIDSNGVLRAVPMNEYLTVSRKGVTPLAGQPSKAAVFRGSWSIPAGSDTADLPNLRAFVSSTIGALNQQSNGLFDTFVNGVL